MLAKERLYLNGGRNRLVRQGDKTAAFLYAAEGDEIPASAAEKFGLVDGRLKASGKRSVAAALLGSSLLPSLVEIAQGLTVQLGAIVARAHKESALDVEAWNDLPEEDREARLAAVVEAMKAEAAKAPPAAPAKPKPASRPARAKAAKAGKEQKPAPDKEQKPAADKEEKPAETKNIGAQGSDA